MTEVDKLYKLVQSHNIKHALIIDDAYDTVPLAEDLLLGGELSSVAEELFRRASKPVKAKLGALLTAKGVEPEDYSEGLAQDEFVAKLWELAKGGKLSRALSDRVFAVFDANQQQKRAQLSYLEDLLQTTLKVEFTPQGRSGGDNTPQAQMIFLDLYLGVTDSETAVDEAVRRIKNLLQELSDAARPLIIVMSTADSARLQEIASRLQERAELLGCKFRAVNKEDFPDALPKALSELLTHWNDAQAVAKWLDAWSAAIHEAATDYIRDMRLLDLSDLAYLAKFRLESESMALGNYLNAMSASYVQYCVEKRLAVSRSDRLLDDLNFEKDPPKHFLPSVQIPRLKHASAFLNDAVIQAAGLQFKDASTNLQLGDLIVQKPKGWKEDAELISDQMPVLVVISQACDIIQNKSDTILLLRGTIRRRDWTAALRKPSETTDVFFRDKQQFEIEWQKAQITAWSRPVADAKLAVRGDHIRIGRFREVEALKLQQIFASNLTRVGTLAAPHPHADVGFQLTAPDNAGSFTKLFEFTPLQKIAAVIDVRPAKGEMYQMLVFNSDAAERIVETIKGCDLSTVKPVFKGHLESIAKSPEKLRTFDAATRIKGGLDFGNGVKIPTSWLKNIENSKDPNKKDERLVKLVMALTTAEK